MENGYKVRAIQKGYYDAIREPGVKNRAGEDLSVFFLRKKSDFSAVWMEPIGWEPEELAEIDSLFKNEEGGLRTPEEVANIKSDLMDEGIRKARAAKAGAEDKDMSEKIQADAPVNKKRKL